MLRRLLEASTRAATASGQPGSSSLPASPTAALPTNPSANLTGPTTASSSSSPGSSSLGPPGPHPYNSTLYLPENDELEYIKPHTGYFTGIPNVAVLSAKVGSIREAFSQTHLNSA